MLDVFLQAEIHSLIRIAGGHHVPASSAAADMVERSEFPRDVIGLVVSRGRGRDQPQCSVTTASAGSNVSGSKEVTVALRFSACSGMFSTARWSAMKKASNCRAPESARNF